MKAVEERPQDSAFELADAFTRRSRVTPAESDVVRLRLTAIRVSHRVVADKLCRIMNTATNIVEVQEELKKLVDKYSAGPDPRVCE